MTVNPTWWISPGRPETTDSIPVMIAPMTTAAIACWAFKPYASRDDPAL